jgi:Tol biopolymer transport system component
MVVCMSTLALSQGLAPPEVITDPKQITAKPDADVEQGEESLSLQRLYMTRQVGDTAWSPDGKSIVFVSNITGRNNLWLVPAEGGWPTQLTVSEQRQTHPTWSPNGRWIAYQSDYDGDEQWDIFFVSPRTGQVVNVTKTREASEENPTWSPDGRYLAYEVKPKDSSSPEIDVFDTVLREVKHVTSGTPADKLNSNPIWSKDGKFIVYTQEEAKGTNSNIFLAELAPRKSTLLTPHEGEKLYFANDFSADGKSVLVTSNAGNGVDNAGLLDVATKKIKWLTEGKWEVQAGHFSPNGKSVTWRANVDGNTDLYIHDLVSGKTTKLPLPKGVNSLGGAESAFTHDGLRLLYYHNGASAPSDAWVYDIASGKSTQVTHSLMAGIPAQHFVEPFLVHYPSRDGKWTISAFV